MSLPRRVEPEWLDDLPAHDPRAMRSRRDLQRVNAVMAQTGLMARALTAYGRRRQPPRTILDLGAGDGTFMLGVARRLARRWQDVTVTLLDQQNLVSAKTRHAFGAVRWTAKPVAADMFGFLAHAAPVDIITANLVLHHFDTPRLGALLAQAAQRSNLFVTCEPRRGRFGLLCSRLLWAIGCNDVTRHDATASVHAGFAGSDLSDLWPGHEPWALQEASAGLFTHRFVAERQGGRAA
jgi:hypothetical protein